MYKRSNCESLTSEGLELTHGRGPVVCTACTPPAESRDHAEGSSVISHRNQWLAAETNGIHYGGVLAILLPEQDFTLNKPAYIYIYIYLDGNNKNGSGGNIRSECSCVHKYTYTQSYSQIAENQPSA